MAYDTTKSAGDVIASADWNTMVGSFTKKTVFSATFGSEGSTVTGSATAWTTIANSDIALNPTIFMLNGSLWMRFIAHFQNNQAATGSVTYIQVVRQNAGTVVTGTTGSGLGTAWRTFDSGWLNWCSESAGGGSESYQIQMHTNGGTATYNSAIMLLSAGSW